MIYHRIDQLIGKTPLFFPERYNAKFCKYGTILCKLECFNPAGSVKDRVALYMLDAAEAAGDAEVKLAQTVAAFLGRHMEG